MKRAALFSLSLLGSVWGANAEDSLDRLGEALSFSTAHGAMRARLSGTVELEAYAFDRPAPGFISAEGDALFNPRLALFLDAQLGAKLYVFAQARADRGFDPADGNLRGRLDEYAVRYSPDGKGAFNLQLGKFATVVGNWVPRHDSWTNPFVTAPLPYENVTGIFDGAAANSTALLLRWANLGPGPFPASEYLAQQRVPVLWGPSYATGAAISGSIGHFDYAAEVKNAALSSRPKVWTLHDNAWDQPTYSGRVGYRPSPAWNFGVSASRGSYLLPSARPTLAPGTTLNAYREVVFAQDVSYAWHHLQLWAEVFETTFAIPRVGDARTVAYYLEARYKFTPQLSGAIRWNQQLFGTVPNGTSGAVKWGRDTWRLDIAPTYRFTPHLQLKLQYSYQFHPLGSARSAQLFGAQAVLRF